MEREDGYYRQMVRQYPVVVSWDEGGGVVEHIGRELP